MPGRPTLADVAAEAGVSAATVSRALADSPLVNEQTRRRVWEVAERLRFTPNRLASSLRRGATLAVGLVVPDVAAAFYATALKGVQETVEAAGYHVLVVDTERDARRERKGLASLRAHQVDGVIVATSGGYESIGVPAVFIDNVPAAAAEAERRSAVAALGAGDAPDGSGEFSGAAAASPAAAVAAPRGGAAPLAAGAVAAVALDNAAGVALLVEHLVRAHGHRRIAYVGPPETVGAGAAGAEGAGRERLEAFRAAVGRAGLALPPEYVRLAGHERWDEEARILAAALLALPEPPTAIVAGADLLALGALRALRDAARRVPEDVALVTFDEPGFADLLDPPLTSLDRHDRELGRRAARRLLDALAGNPAVERVERVPLTLHARRSCGCGG